MGCKAISASTLGGAATAAGGAGRSLKERQDVGVAQESVVAIQRQIAELEAEFQAELQRLSEGSNPLTEVLETVEIKPRKSDVAVRLVTLAWMPYRRSPDGQTQPA